MDPCRFREGSYEKLKKKNEGGKKGELKEGMRARRQKRWREGKHEERKRSCSEGRPWEGLANA